jgi:hypothetical protein
MCIESRMTQWVFEFVSGADSSLALASAGLAVPLLALYHGAEPADE